ncbi:hypothetical protein BDV96DRAFT_139481 [Lophiotrema nucula]|uniref:Uncharacterized protein n=1 Tax=Lophiotrema nucula TaxID=690887 RepID=A0A6A5ZSD4_9PLEO|nr:hypothetical protein BDV96DRAFT_139481 [Lophiotrema nucula]
MKSSLILASLLSFALAGPLSTRDEDPCACDFFCVAELEAGCKCEIASKNKCHAAHQAAGLNCPEPSISEACQPFAILHVSVTTTTASPTATPTPAKKGEECGTFRGAVCDSNLICVVEDPLCADCAGVCQSDQCRGIQNIECPGGWECVVDEDVCGENGNDCAGRCEIKSEARARL